ncbi:MAG: metal ABC transporter substrate-binding protein [Pseudomonadota bacterium]
MGRQLIAVLAFVVLATAGWAQDKLRVVAVNYPLQYFAERLLGDEAADVIVPVPEGVDPSFWRPSISDISAIQAADLILLNGAGFATWTDKVSLPRSKLVTTSRGLEDRFITTQSITHSHGDGGTHSHEGVGSYLWLDVSMAAEQASAVANAIVARGLADAAQVDARLSELVAELDALDQAAHDSLVGAADAVFVATHPRYQYLARAYGLTIKSLEWDAGAMPSKDDLADLETLTRQFGATILIWEAEPPQAARTAVAELGLTDVVFPTLAIEPSEMDMLEALETAFGALSDAVAQTKTMQ